MNKKYVKITAIVIAIVFILGIAGPLAYIAFSMPDNVNGTNSNLNNKDKKSIQEELEKLSQKIEKAEEIHDKLKQEGSERFRLMAERGWGSYKDIIFSSDSISDLTDRVIIARELSDYDKNTAEAVEELKNEIIDASKEKEELLEKQELSEKEELLNNKETEKSNNN